jgi:hypothetical protein
MNQEAHLLGHWNLQQRKPKVGDTFAYSRLERMLLDKHTTSVCLDLRFMAQ